MFRISWILFLLLVCSGFVPADNSAGVVKFQNSGKPEAQETFLYGLALLHNFEYEDAAEAFRKAQQADPGFAISYWGEAMTQNHPIWMEQDLETARSVLQKLGNTAEDRLAKAPTEREKDYLRAIEILYGPGEKRARDLAYAEAMERLAQKYPDDPDAVAFYALSLLGTAHEGRDFSIYMRAAAVLEEVFDKHPAHPGILHYLIHCYDDAIHAPLGLRAARRYSDVAPSAAHAQHMTSHIYVALGMWDEVVEANENASGVVNRNRAARGESLRYCGHYNHWLEYGYLQQGRFEDAKALLEKCFSNNKTESMHTHPGMRDPLDADNLPVASFLVMKLRYLLETADWSSDVINWNVTPGDNLGARLTHEFTVGYGAAERGELAQANASLQQIKAIRRDLDEYLNKKGYGQEAYRQRAAIFEQQVQAKILVVEGKLQEAVELLQSTAKIEGSMRLDFGPPFVDKPTRELLGEILLKANRPEEAEKAFAAALAQAPLRSLSLLGLAQAAERAGHSEKVKDIRGKLQGSWKAMSRR